MEEQTLPSPCQFTCDLEVNFESDEKASIVCAALNVDKERLYPEKKIAKRVKKGSRAKQVVKKRDDLFSRLPDAVIVSHILSRFSLEEGSRFCLLSRRWKTLWGATIGSKLVFSPLGDSTSFQATQSVLKPTYERWISNVVQASSSNDALTKLDELTVRYPFDSSHANSIDMWIESAFKKSVGRLVLETHASCIRDFYCLPEIDKFQGMLTNCVFNLRDVELRYVYVTPQVIEFMLAHFPLERLCITQGRISELSVSGERLKILELSSRCKHLKISASNLTSFTYGGTEDSVLFEHVPNLSELSVENAFSSTFLPTTFLNARAYVTQLKRLEVAMTEGAVGKSVNYPLEFPYTLNNLEELKIITDGRIEDCFLWLVLLIKAAPFLRKLSVQVRFISSRPIEANYVVDARGMRNAAMTVRNHQYLKTIEFHRYSEEPNLMEFVQHLLGVSDVLEEFIVTPAPVLCPEDAPIMRAMAEAIADWIPPTSKAKLIVL